MRCPGERRPDYDSSDDGTGDGPNCRSLGLRFSVDAAKFIGRAGPASRMSLTGSLDATATDHGVEFTFDVRNEGDGDVELTFSDARKADVVVRDGDEAVWRYSEGRMFAQMIQQATLGGGEVETFQVVWEDPEPGDYEAVATLAARNADVEAATSFSV